MLITVFGGGRLLRFRGSWRKMLTAPCTENERSPMSSNKIVPTPLSVPSTLVDTSLRAEEPQPTRSN